jgi:phosphoribosyl-ATP pyrophosphohydrolase
VVTASQLVGNSTIGVYPVATNDSSPTASSEPMGDSLEPISRLMETLAKRARAMPSGSYTTKLLQGGVDRIGGKIREEADELIEAADEPGDDGREHFVYEAADLIYHTLALLAWRGVDLQEVAAELARREGTSGLVEKASRQPRSEE